MQIQIFENTIKKSTAWIDHFLPFEYHKKRRDILSALHILYLLPYYEQSVQFYTYEIPVNAQENPSTFEFRRIFYTIA